MGPTDPQLGPNGGVWLGGWMVWVREGGWGAGEKGTRNATTEQKINLMQGVEGQPRLKPAKSNENRLPLLAKSIGRTAAPEKNRFRASQRMGP